VTGLGRGGGGGGGGRGAGGWGGGGGGGQEGCSVEIYHGACQHFVTPLETGVYCLLFLTCLTKNFQREYPPITPYVLLEPVATFFGSF